MYNTCTSKLKVSWCLGTPLGMAEITTLHLLFTQILFYHLAGIFWRNAKLLFEDLGKIMWVVYTYLIAYFSHRYCLFSQQFRCPVHPECLDVFGRRLSGQSLDFLEENGSTTCKIVAKHPDQDSILYLVSFLASPTANQLLDIRAFTHEHRYSDWWHENRMQPTGLCVPTRTLA